MLRIQGLVRYFNQVRAQLQAGIPPSEAEAFQKQVTGTVLQIEQLCQRHRTTPERLPGPSRSAYRFLRELDLKNLPVRPAEDSARPLSTLRLKNVTNFERYFAQQMWERLPVLKRSAQKRTELRKEMQRHTTQIQRICTARGATPGALALPSRQVYCWLEFLTAEDNLALHLHALQRAADALAGAAPHLKAPVHVQLLHMASLWRTQHSGSLILLKASEGFVHADEAVWQAIVRCAGKRERADDVAIRAFAETDDFREVIVEIDTFAEPPTSATRGRAHDLEESFARVNGEYFGGLMPRPRLSWSRTLPEAKLGHYQAAADRVMIVASLDDPRVAAEIVDFVMYHELLHKKHGATIVNGRRLVHTAAFRADERRFADYERLNRQLNDPTGSTH